MRSYLPEFIARSASSLDDALAQLGEPPHPELGAWQPLAGGTDLMVLLAAGKLPRGRYLDIFGLTELRGITVAPQHVDLGALTTYTQVREHPLLQAEFPMLVQAAVESGAHAIQNRGTLGGNIANASPAADSPPALLAYGAELLLRSATGSRVLAYADFHTGYKKTRMLPGELIAGVRLPRLAPALREPGRAVHYYRKVGTRRAQAISKVCLAALCLPDGTGSRLQSCRIALGSVAPVPLRCPRTEAALVAPVPGPLDQSRIAAAQAVLAQEIAPISDIRSSADYRLRVAQNLLAQVVQTCFPGLCAASSLPA
jgi:CO/xanthine dehydrogenase FAD-binding subunit